MITAEFNKFYLVTAYVTNAGKKLVNLDKRMRWDLMFRLAQDYLPLIKTCSLDPSIGVTFRNWMLRNLS